MANKIIKREDYLRKPYTRIITPDEQGGYTGEILEFPGCIAEGETAGETYEALERAALSWIEAALEQGQEIPEPSETSYGGKIALRLPRSLHKRVARFAERNAISINQFLVSAISMMIGTESVYDHLDKRVDQMFAGRLTRILNLTVNMDNHINVHFSDDNKTVDAFDAPEQMVMEVSDG